MRENEVLEFTNSRIYAYKKKDILMHRRLKTIYHGEVKGAPKEYKKGLKKDTEYVIIY